VQTYHRPDTVDEALKLLASGELRVAAGCTDLFPLTQERALPWPVLDITNIKALRGITQTDTGWRIGGATTWTDILRADLPPVFDGLKLAGREVGSVQIQNSGTIAGNLCTASPAGDGIPCLMILDASVELASVRGNRVLPLEEFLTRARQTALKSDELLTAVHVPDLPGQSDFTKLGDQRCRDFCRCVFCCCCTVARTGNRIDWLFCGPGLKAHHNRHDRGKLVAHR